MTYESFSFIEEGIVYCRVKEIKKDKIVLETDKIKEFDKEFWNEEIKEGDYVRVYIKNNRIIYLEKIDKEFFEKIKELIQ